ncbi:hypothetical protein [Actinokineospora terrae]|uniref:Dynamin family protein n=1 Tax=Actinokineospora terrae TaxID=155974 RepID=A0A1H9P165_9PSEU|nr:hypothetical protein [Actinokineospora terrae]SER41930.1 hypothetical protein SAMN04487818_103238 [Actinokineospora terrae]
MLDDEVAAFVAARRARVPAVVAEVEAWRRAERALTRAGAGADVLAGVSAVISDLRRVVARLDRAAIAVAVGGKRGTGKSTLARSIAGLNPAALPAAPGTRLVLRAGPRRRATLLPRTFAELRTSHLRPRHLLLGLPEPPTSAADLRAWRYPEPGDQGYLACAHPSLLADLRAIQASSVDLLDRRGRPLRFDDPLDAAAAAARAPHAVREVLVERERVPISLHDLPGTGAVTISTDLHVVAGLDIDVVLQVVRGHWCDADARATAVLGEAGAPVLVVLNGGESVPRGVDPLTALRADVRDREAVAAEVVAPLLRDLANRIPAADAELLAEVRAGAEPLRVEMAEHADLAECGFPPSAATGRPG